MKVKCLVLLHASAHRVVIDGEGKCITFSVRKLRRKCEVIIMFSYYTCILSPIRTAVLAEQGA